MAVSVKRRAAKRDANEGEIILALTAAGCSVQQLSEKGVPDLLVWSPVAGLLLMEVKGAKGKLTQDQVAFANQWGGDIHIVRSIQDALEIAGR
jgi:hypothetical protein